MNFGNFSPHAGRHEDFSGIHTAGASTLLGPVDTFKTFGKITGGLGVKSTALGKSAAA